MRFEDKLWVLKDADDGSRVSILPKMANRHGLIAGATGTGKTVSLKVLAESFSEMGVPVFLSDVKGDLAGCCEAGADSEDMRKRIDYFGLEGTGFQFRSFPVQFFDLSGERGLPLRTTVSEMGRCFCQGFSSSRIFRQISFLSYSGSRMRRSFFSWTPRIFAPCSSISGRMPHSIPENTAICRSRA